MKEQTLPSIERAARRRFGSAMSRGLSTRLLIDQTTRLPNHFAFELFYQRSHRLGRSLAVIELDIAGFGRFNERRGGLQRGNELLANFAIALTQSIKSTDFVARWSVGDEFVIAATGVTTTKALQRLCERLEGPFVVKWGRRHRLLRCYTVGILTGGMRLEEVERVLHERLRQKKVAAKRAGRS
ncbi:MAG TPA: diguanylate cyclase [Vicinamibacterales bacterium]|nr:diguanylate cyclase [Vicinamibacterales bacterium]